MRPRGRHLASAASLLAIVVAALALAAPGAGAAGLTTLRIQTVPQLAGVKVVVDGVPYVTGKNGGVVVFTKPGHHVASIVPPASSGSGEEVRFAGWVDRNLRRTQTLVVPRAGLTENVGFVLWRTASIRLLDPRGAELPLSSVTRATVTSTGGGVWSFTASRPSLVLAANTITRSGSRLISDAKRYTVNDVMMRGSNVVHEGSQHFFLSGSQPWTIRVLIFPLRIETHDALFRFGVGNAVRLLMPDHSSRRIPLGPGHAVTVEGLPRGSYTLRASGPGLALTSPTILSRSQTATVLLFSWLDVTVVLAVAALFVIGLPLLGRRIVRRPGRRLPAWVDIQTRDTGAAGVRPAGRSRAPGP